MRHHIRILLLSTVFIFVCSKADAQHVVISPEAYRTALEEEFTKYGASRYLYENADSYEKLIWYRLQQRLGLDPSQLNTESEFSPEITSIDTISKDITSKINGDQDETTIAVSRSDPRIIVAGANDLPGMNSGMPAYYTLDGGNNWSTTRIKIPKINGVNASILGDPAVVSDDVGNFYYAYLAGANDGTDNLIVASSKDGKLWTNGGFIVPPDSVGGFEDKENICVDHNPASPHYGRLYVVWLHFNCLQGSCGGGGRISWSDDKGKTWSIPKHVTDSLVKFCEVRTGKNGEVFLTFSFVETGSQTGSHLFLVSTDGGENFEMNSLADFMLYPPRTAIDNRPALKGDAGIRAYPYIAHDVDLKTNRIHLVYGTWYDDGSGINLPAAALLYTSSTDLGKTWTSPLPLGISNPNFNRLDRDRFCPWVSVNQKTGDAYCSYYSSERDPNNGYIAAFRTKLTNDLKEYPHALGQADFDPTFLTRAQSFSGLLIPFIGDYQGSDSYDTVYAAVWTQGLNAIRNDGDVYVYIQSPNRSAGTGGVSVVVKSDNLWLSAPSPNPVSSQHISFTCYFPASATAEIAFYSSTGVKVKTLAQEKFESGTYTKEYGLQGLPSGSYILRLSTSYGSVEKALVITK